MPEDEEQIRTLIERWAYAVHGGDMDGVLADHSRDIVMFDVPPPHEGVRGIDAYRDTWPPFFEWQAGGALFEIVSLDVTAGDEVAYVHALLRCGTPQELAEQPANRLASPSDSARSRVAGWSRTSITRLPTRRPATARSTNASARAPQTRTAGDQR